MEENQVNENSDVKSTTNSESYFKPKPVWSKYLLEFIMVFLAVFLGVLAENWRENIAVQAIERDYIRSLVADIKNDSLEIQKSISRATITLRYQDSVIFYLYNNHPVDFLPQYFLEFDLESLRRLNVVFNTATALQLKSGNLRLIQNQKVTRMISLYWNEQENTKTILDRYLIYRNRGREFLEQLVAFSDTDLLEGGLLKSLPKGIRVIQSNPVLWAQYANILSHCKVTTKGYLEQLKKQLQSSNEMILLLRKEYDLK